MQQHRQPALISLFAAYAAHVISLLPQGVAPAARRILYARTLRSFADGYVALLLPRYLTLLGFNAWEIGLLITATLLGTGMMTLAAGFAAHRMGARRLLALAALLMCGTGMAMGQVSAFWPLLLIAFFGTVNPSGGDVSVFLPLEQSLLAHASPAASRTALFARYSLFAGLASAVGAQSAALPELAGLAWHLSEIQALQLMFLLYGVVGLGAWLIYRSLPRSMEPPRSPTQAALGPSRGRVYRMAAVFSLDAFGSGFAVQSLLALWLYQRFGMPVSTAATLFFWLALLAAVSHPVASWIASRIGLINTMVFTHLPANVLCVMAPFMPNLELVVACLCVRAFLSSMDVPTRTSYVMAVVTPPERPAAASMTQVPRTFTGAISPAIAGYLFTLSPFGWPLVACGLLKIAYDITLLSMFRQVKPPEEN